MLEAQPETALSQLAITADAVLDSLGDASSTASGGAAINAIGAADDRLGRLDKLEKRLDKHESTLQQINNKLGQLLTSNRSRQNDRSQSRSRRSSTPHRTSTIEQASTTCWYHREYGTSARKCEKPCDFSTSTADKTEKN